MRTRKVKRSKLKEIVGEIKGFKFEETLEVEFISHYQHTSIGYFRLDKKLDATIIKTLSQPIITQAALSHARRYSPTTSKYSPATH